MRMDKMLLFDTDRCTGCQLCEQICSFVHTKTSNPERSRIRILKIEQSGLNIQIFCQQCDDAACIAACPVSAIDRSESTGAIEIDQELCMKCEECVSACPFQSMHFDRMDDKITTCDLCGGDPQCALFCQTKAIEFLDKHPSAIQKKRDALQALDRLLKLVKDH